jgi:hypothetical protein
VQFCLPFLRRRLLRLGGRGCPLLPAGGMEGLATLVDPDGEFVLMFDRETAAAAYIYTGVGVELLALSEPCAIHTSSGTIPVRLGDSAWRIGYA